MDNIDRLRQVVAQATAFAIERGYTTISGKVVMAIHAVITNSGLSIDEQRAVLGTAIDHFIEVTKAR